MTELTRAWNEAVAALADLVPGGVTGLVFWSLLTATLVALAWYFWPAWLPWTWRWRASDRRRDRRRDHGGWRGLFRLGRLRWRLRLRWRRRRTSRPAGALDLPPDELPDLPAEVLALSADQLAAEGRYAEAVRERLRAIVRELIERGVIPFSPGWTVTELAQAAARARPGLHAPLDAAARVFSDIWYGQRPAEVAADAEMRTHAESVRRVLAAPVPTQPVIR